MIFPLYGLWSSTRRTDRLRKAKANKQIQDVKSFQCLFWRSFISLPSIFSSFIFSCGIFSLLFFHVMKFLSYFIFLFLSLHWTQSLPSPLRSLTIFPPRLTSWYFARNNHEEIAMKWEKLVAGAHQKSSNSTDAMMTRVNLPFWGKEKCQQLKMDQCRLH